MQRNYKLILTSTVPASLVSFLERHVIGESRIVRLDKVSYLCTVILNYSNYGTR